MLIELSGKKVLVTGSTRGIGWFIAKAFHSGGCSVILNGRNPEDLEAAVAQLPGSIGIVGDVTKVEEANWVVAEAVNILGQLDILICNVGSGRSVPPGNETPEEWQRVFALNLWSTTNTVDAARQALASTKGVIVCVSSICGLEVIANAPVTYSAAKAALHSYVRGISRPLAKQDIRINAVALGNILFDGSVWEKKLADNPQVVQEMLFRDVPIGRLGKTSDVVSLVSYLASECSSFATGGVWTLDGGQTRS